ncbi:amidoligase family protein [Actinotalea sp. JY-7885]|uniref:amidoligase family protein n=1 Tax=Actinotalea sp. JY-7885 TaxID=2758576 RepID=UPI00165EA494|nr:amidoligase family protein [Actinotalea sp. JY-7885]
MIDVHELSLRTGFEIELLAPAGSDRQVLAAELAARAGGRVERSFHTDSEPSAVPGVGVFRHLSPAFDVVDAAGRPVARLVDDITIAADLAGHPGGAGHRGWYRVLSDDARLLRLVERYADPGASMAAVLEPVAALFGIAAEVLPAATRLNDERGATIAIALPLPAGRERPCEIVTPPIASGHTAALEALLGPARELGFTVPHEAAVHLHVDGAPFREVPAFANVVRLFAHWREVLWEAFGTNPACRRLAPLPDDLVELVDRPWEDDSARTGWERLRQAARSTGVTKYADVNLTQLLSDRPVRDTLEVRILPGAEHAHAIVSRAAVVEALLRRCRDPEPLPLPGATAARDPLDALDTLVAVRR